MQPEKIVILNNKNQKLVGYLYKNTSKTIVIMCHGIESLKGVPGMDEVFEGYHAKGSSVFYFDFSGYGESEGKKNISIKQRVLEIGSIIEYFAPHYKKIILYGISFCALPTAIAASNYTQVTNLILVSGMFSFNPLTLRPRVILSLYSYLLTHPSAWAELWYWRENIKMLTIRVPVLIICGEKDEIIHPKQSKDFYNKLSTEKRFVSVPNGDHALMKKEFFPFTKAVPEYIETQVIYT